MSVPSIDPIPKAHSRHLVFIAKHFVVYGFGGAVEKVVAFILIPLYTNYIPPHDYGVLVRALIMCAVLGLLISGGLHAALLKFYADAPEPSQKISNYSTILLYVWLVTPVSALLVSSFAGVLSEYLLGSREYVRLIYLGLLYLPLGMTIDLAATCLRAMQRSVAFVILSFSRFALALTMNIVFIVGMGLGVDGILWSGIVVNAVGSVAVQAVLLRDVGFHPNYRQLSPILAFGLPLVPGTIIELLIQDANKFFVGMFCPAEAVGIFSFAYKLSLAVFFLVIMPFERVWSAYIFDLYKKPEGREVFARILTYLILILTTLGLMLSLFAVEIVQVMSARAYWEAAPLVPLLVFAHLPYASTRVFNSSLLVTGATGLLSWFTIIGLAVNVAANLLLIPRWGPPGAAWATFITYSIMAGLSYYLGQRKFHVEYEWKRLIILIGLACALYGISLLSSPENLFGAIILHVALFAAFPIGLLLCGFFTQHERKTAIEWIGKGWALLATKFARG